LLPGGGVGGYAIGGWLLHLTGAPTRWIVRRAGGLFFLTSAVNSAAGIGAGLLLLAGAAGPDDFARATLPALLAGAATLIVLALPRCEARAARRAARAAASSRRGGWRAPLRCCARARGAATRACSPRLAPAGRPSARTDAIASAAASARVAGGADTCTSEPVLGFLTA
jgi:hypothetical protein